MKKFDDALWYYNESIKFNKNYDLPILNIINILAFFDTKTVLNKYISTNNKIRQLNFDLNIDKLISDDITCSFF